jgi:hypothetical protein
MTLRHRTMKMGERLDEKARDRAWFEPPSSSQRKQKRAGKRLARVGAFG